MTNQKYYAVAKGKTPGVYLTWADCQNQTSGFSGAIFQKFYDKTEAEAFVANHGVDPFDTQPATQVNTPDNDVDYLSDRYNLVYFVDGSYNPDTNVVGAGLVVVSKGTIINEIPYTLDNKSNMRNVFGEIFATVKAAENAILVGEEKIAIVYDYQGIESWANRDWKAKNQYTQLYADKMNEFAKKLEIDFHKVKSHTGIEFNEAVDLVAKRGAGVN